MRRPTQHPGERERTSGGARRVLARVRRAERAGLTGILSEFRTALDSRCTRRARRSSCRAACRCRAGDLTWPWPGLLHPAGTVYSLIHEGENGGPVRGGRGGRGGGRRQRRAAAGPTASGSNLDGAGSCHVPSRGFGAACRATGHGRTCSPLPPSLTCPGGQGPDPGGVAGARARLGT